jgi:hypothetical protein
MFEEGDLGESIVNIRSYQPGDEESQVAIYNESAGQLPQFKPANLADVQRRVRDREFDPQSRVYAEVDGHVVGYAAYQDNGRVSYPWCWPSHERAAEPLFDAVLEQMRQKGIRKAFAAYRDDWKPVLDFFSARGFVQAREIINFYIDLADLPTASARMSRPVTPLVPADMPALLELAPPLLRGRTAAELEQWYLHNPYFPSDCIYVLRGRTDDSPRAVGILVSNPNYAKPQSLDPAMPCFRLGTFGSEYMTTKRINGLFSFLVRDNPDLMPLGLDLLGHGASRVWDQEDVTALAAQVPSDVPHLLYFYTRYFRRQGSFPILERDLIP